MSVETTADTVLPGTGIDCRNALVTKIALFLNYLSRDDFQKLVRYFSNKTIMSESEILKHMLERKYLNSRDIASLKKACLNFAKAQEDTRFGSLCIQFEFLTQSNLNLALEEQKRMTQNGQSIFLGDLLVDAGMLSERQRKLILQKQKMETSMREPKNAPAKERFHKIQGTGMTLMISQDKLNAFLVKTDQFNAKTTVDDIRDFLDTYSIIYGVVSNDELREFIKNDADETEKFRVAKGQPPKDCVDAEIVYKFERDYLKVGALTEEGNIDFKNRGEIPHTNEGDILAEKIPARPGRDGVNVFGGNISAPEPLDTPLTCGKGVKISEDGLRVTAIRDGFPRINRYGQIAVNEAYFLKGDVDFTTGHIKFEQSVFITGTIKSGFRVEAIDVVANAVDGGTIRAKGDICIHGGATNADINAKGSITAGHIKTSKISCMGDMTVTKEVVDTTIVMEGTFKMVQGKMFSSFLFARGGARIWHVGAEKASPCQIWVGTNHYLDQETKDLDLQYEKIRAAFENKGIEKKQMREKLGQVEEELAQLDPDKTDKNSPHPQRLAFQQEMLQRKLEKIRRQLDIFSEAMEKTVREKFNLKKIGQEVPSKPILDVKGRLLARTVISGRYTKKIISSDMARVRVMEISSRHEGSENEHWEMVASRL